MKIIMSEDLRLPLDIVTNTMAILAKRRAGKSYTARKLTEQLFKVKQQIVIVDPKGDWWGVRSSIDGKKAGLSVIIFGGEHADVPLEVGAGEMIARLAVEERLSMLLDLSLFRKHEVATFMTCFLENFYRLKAKEIYRTPVMLMIDEADAIAPQKPQKGEERMLGAAEDIVRRGGQRGIGCCLVTQRSAVLNKNVLTQCQILVCLRTIAPQDLDAMKNWIDVHGTLEQQKTLMGSLPSLPTGDAWFWSPGYPTDEGIFKRIHVDMIETFDSGATPKPGEKRIIPKTLADVDLNAIKKRMSDTIEKAKANNPDLLKKRIADLEKQISKSAIHMVTGPDPKSYKIVIEKAIKADRQQTEIKLKKYISNIQKAFLENITLSMKDESGRMIARILNRIKFPDPPKWEYPDPEEMKRIMEFFAKPGQTGIPIVGKVGSDINIRPIPRSSPISETTNDKSLPYGEKRTLTAIAQNSEGVERKRLTVLTGYKRASRNTYLQRLSSKGFISFDNKTGKIYSTPEGTVALGSDFESLPEGRDLIEYYLRKLPKGEKIIFEILLTSGIVSREDLSEKANYTRSSRNTYLQRLFAKELIEYPDSASVKISERISS